MLNPDSEIIIGQYRQVAGAYNRLWKETEIRSYGSAWREDGIGSCGIGKTLSERGIEGPARDEIIKLRDLRNSQTSGESKHCPNHRLEGGCVLGDLKSPFCLGYIDPALFDEIPDRFGIMLLDIRSPLAHILRGNADDQYVKASISGVKTVIDYIKTYPILHPEEVE